jgi:signal transduction histidine kinase
MPSTSSLTRTEVRPSRASDIAAGIRTTMERAITAVRIVSAAYCVAIFGKHSHTVPHPAIGWAVLSAVVAWTAFAAWVQVIGPARRGGPAAGLRWAPDPSDRPGAPGGARFAVADVAVVLALTVLTMAVQSHAQRSGLQPTLTTVWAVCPALTAGARRGIRAGMGAALIQALASVVVRGGADATTISNSLLLLLAGTATGYLAQLATRAEVAAVAAAAERAALAERERLARDIHDSVLQVLSLVNRRGRELGGGAEELGRLAGEQEVILRGLVARPAPTLDGGHVDLADACSALRGADVTVSAPGHPVLVDPWVAHELLAAARSALDNVARHGGNGARAWVLLEDGVMAGDEEHLVLSIRDDGVGVSAQRLAEAAGDERMGVARSILARVADIGGHATVGPAPGGGAEVELTIPLAAATGRR